MSMEDYKKLVNRLRDEPKDSRKAVLSIYDLCIDAAYAIEILLDKLKYAEGERDAVTRHMIELEQEVCRLKSRLAAYEETGLEPEEIYEVRFLIAAQRDPQKLARLRELVLADQDGRLHITPAFVWHNGDSGLHEVPYKPWMAQWIATGTKFWLTREEAEAALAQEGDSER